MGFLSGRITYVRYRVGGTSPLPFGEEILEQAQLNTRSAGMAEPTRTTGSRSAGRAATTSST